MSAADYTDDYQLWLVEQRASKARVLYAEQVVRALILAAGGPFEQRQPTREQCCTGLLDGLAAKPLAWLRSSIGRAELARHGLTQAQVEAWRESAERRVANG